jgi:hypothetical protein
MNANVAISVAVVSAARQPTTAAMKIAVARESRPT